MGYELVRMMNQRQMPAPLKTVWKALGDHASDLDGRGAWPSQKTLADETGYTERHVRNILRQLEARGAILETRKPGRRTSREYRIIINPPALQQELRPEKISALESMTSHQQKTPENSKTEVKTGNFCNQDRKSVHQDRKSEAVKTGKDFRQTLIEPSVNPKKENPQNARARDSRDIDIDSQHARESRNGDGCLGVGDKSLALSRQRNLMIRSRLYTDDEISELKAKELSELQHIHAARLYYRQGFGT